MKLFLFLAVLLWGGVAAAQTATVADIANVNMRSGKAENYRIIRVLPPRAELEVIEVDQEYVKVKTADGETGWVLRKFLEIHKTEKEKTNQNQAALDAAQKELVAARVELASLQREMEQMSHAQNTPPVFTFLLVGLAAFAGGVLIGILILKAYYHKRLHGLRI